MQKEQVLNIKNQYADWNLQLQDKISKFRNEKNSWQKEAVDIRAAHQETQVGCSSTVVHTAKLNNP